MSEQANIDIAQPQAATHIVYSVLRFLRVVRHRKMIVLTTLVIAALLGAFYYATAERIYQAKASLLVMNNTPEVWNESVTKDNRRQGMLPTYERLFSSAVVLERAVSFLDELPQEARVDLAPFPREKWLDELRDRLNAQAVRATDIIEISYLSGKPRTAETVVNAIVQSYTDFIEESHKSVAGEIAQLLQVELTRVDDRLREKQQQLLIAKQNVKDLGISHTDVVHPVVDRAIKTQDSLMEVRQKRMQLQASMSALNSAIQQGGNLQQHLLALEPTVGREVVLAALGRSTKDVEVISRLEQLLFEEQAKLEAESAFHFENHPKVQLHTRNVRRLQTEIATYAIRQSQLASEADDQQLGELLTALVSEDLRQTWIHEQALIQEYDSAEKEALQLATSWEGIRVLKTREEHLQNLAETLRTRLDNIDIKTNQSDVRVAVVSEAIAKNRPVSPRLLWVLFVCTAIGTGAGLGIVYVMDVLDDRFRSPEELREQLGTPVLAIIRQLPVNDEKGVAALQVHTSPDSLESEAFRTLRTTIAFSAEEMDCLAISSSEPGDGKTTVISNFGIACSQAGRRTLMIDADMRRPGMSKLFDVRGEKGLGDILRGDEDVSVMAQEFVRETGANDLDMMPAGMRPTDPTGMLSGQRFSELLAWAQSNYDQILIDTPPILAASDATIIGRIVDGLILVVQPEKNHRRLVHRAAEEVLAANLNFMGVVANKVSGQSTGYYGGGYGYGYGYGYGHAGYGDHDVESAVHVATEVDTHEDSIAEEHESPPIDALPMIRPRRAA